MGWAGQLRELRRRNHQLERELVSLQAAWTNLTTRCGVYQKAADESARIAAQLQHAQKMEALGTLASGVAHDFNNLLMGIGSCAEIASHALPASSHARHYLQEIKSAATSGATISRHLLAFARKRPVDAAVFELNQAVDHTRSMLERLLGEDIRLVVSLDAIDSRVCTDPGYIEQILLNLAVNARDAMNEGGRLTLATSNVTIAKTNPHRLSAGDYIALTITDTGPGIPPHVLEHLFEPFFTTKAVGKGTGLGLSTVQGIVSQAGGCISARNQPGGGARFDILWPKSNQPITRVVGAQKADTVDLCNATALLVEDHRAVRMGARFYLEQGGLRVLEASDGEEALALARNTAGPIDVLVTDVVLPGMSGRRVARAIRDIRREIAVVFMSAHPTEWLQREGRLHCGTATLQKPFGRDQLLSRVSAVLSGKRADSPVSDSAGQSSDEKPAQSSHRGTILVVEDEPMSRDLIAYYLGDAGWTVLTAPDGPEAIELCRGADESVDMLLTDYTLPSTQGDALARALRQTYPDLSVVYMSGYSDLELDPPGPLLTKPLALTAIAEAVEQARKA